MASIHQKTRWTLIPQVRVKVYISATVDMLGVTQENTVSVSWSNPFGRIMTRRILLMVKSSLPTCEATTEFQKLGKCRQHIELGSVVLLVAQKRNLAFHFLKKLLQILSGKYIQREWPS